MDPELRTTIRDLVVLTTLLLIFSLVIVSLRGLIDVVFMQWLMTVSEQISTYGIANVWTPYPQLMNVILYGIYTVSGGNIYLFWTVFKSLNIAANSIIMICIYLTATEVYERTMGRWLAIVFIFLFTPAYYTVLVECVYDPIPVALMMFSVYFLIKDKFLLSAGLAGVGGGIKLFPLAVLAVLVKYQYNRREFVNMGKSLLVGSLGLVPLLVLFALNPPIFLSTYAWQMGRPPSETVYGFALWIADVPYSVDLNYYADVAQEFTSYLKVGITPYPEIMLNPVPFQSTSSWVMTAQTMVMLFGALLMVYVFFRIQVNNKKQMLTFTLFFVCAFVILLRQYAPQYLIWIIPLLLLWKPGRISELATIGLVALTTLEYPLSYIIYVNTNSVLFAWVFWITIILRTVVMLTICLKIYVSAPRGSFRIGRLLRSLSISSSVE